MQKYYYFLKQQKCSDKHIRLRAIYYQLHTYIIMREANSFVPLQPNQKQKIFYDHNRTT